MNHIFYCDYSRFRLTIFDLLNINHRLTCNVNQAIAHPGTVILLLGLHVPDYSQFEKVVIARASAGKKTKIILDSAWEDLDDHQLEESYNRDYMKYLNPSTDIMIAYNSIRDSRISKPIDKIKSHAINFHAVDAYVKCVLRNHPKNDSLVKDRLNGANLLVGKIQTKFSRFLTTYYFYKYGLLDSGVMGINALPSDIEGMMDAHPEYNDADYYNKIIQHLGPADNADIIVTNEGITANDGWPFDHTIFQRSSITYVCETFDVDKHFGCSPYIVTEKFYRAIVNKHPFVVQANPGQIDSIKRLGYKTFDSIIDETYNDYVEPNWMHVEPAVKAAKELIEKIPYNVEQVQEIVDYNYAHFCRQCQLEYDMLLEAIENFAK
jgi:hypothetical protein